MTKRMLIDATHAEETRVVVLDGNRLEDFDVETSTKRQLKGNIYLAKVVRVEPSLQACFVEYGGNRHGFLAFSEIHPDYYQIPVADRQRLIDQEAEEARREEEEADRELDGAPDPAPSSRGTVVETAAAWGASTAAPPDIATEQASAAPDAEAAAPPPETATAESGDQPGATTATLPEIASKPEPTALSADAAVPPVDDTAAPAPSGDGAVAGVHAVPAEEVHPQPATPPSEPDDRATGDLPASAVEVAPAPADPGAAPAGTEAGASAADTEAVASAAGTETAAPSTDTATAAFPAGTEAVASAAGTETAAPSTDTATAAFPAGTETAAPSTDTATAASPADAETATPSPGTTTMASAAGTETAAPSTDTTTAALPANTAPSPATAAAEVQAAAAEAPAEARPAGLAPDSPAGGDAPAAPEPGDKPDPPSRRAQPLTIESDTISGPVEAEPDDEPDAPDDSGFAVTEADTEHEPDLFPDHDIIPESLPPETVGGEPDSAEEQRERRPPSRYLRNYKIQEVIRRRQILLVQVVKEERGTKGAALTTYLSLAGRFSVLMPNSPRGGGISRKITSATDRRRLKEAVAELDMPKGMGLIVRTAGANRPKPEIKRDCEYLLRLWDDIREHTMKSVAPALIYEEASLIKRAIRDVYSRDIDEIQVDGEEGWRAAHEFMRMLMPSHAKKVQLWRDPTQPLFTRYQVEAQLDSMLQPTVQLRSGGYLVINQAEALVAIDVNSGRSTRERNVEETALRTNLEAADEVARQLRLRDLAGLIVIDFIDMEQKKHNAMVERRIKEALKNDRARIQVGHISHFGLLEMSRQRLRPSLAETSFILCPHCGGTGHVRSTESAAIHVLRGIEEEGSKRRAAEVLVHVATPTALYILNHKRDRLNEIELRYGMRVTVVGDDTQMTSQFRIDRLRPQVAREGAIMAITPDAPQPVLVPPEVEQEEAEDIVVEDNAELDEGGPGDADTEADTETGADSGGDEAQAEGARGVAETAEQAERRRRRRRRRRGGRREDGPQPQAAEAPVIIGMPDRDALSVPDLLPSEPDDAAAEQDLASPDMHVEGVPEHAEPMGEDDARRRRGRRGGRRRRREPGDSEGSPFAAPGAEQPDLMPVYAGPTPANPFGGQAFDIFDVLEQAEAAAARLEPAAPAMREAPPEPEAVAEAPPPVPEMLAPVDPEIVNTSAPEPALGETVAEAGVVEEPAPAEEAAASAAVPTDAALERTLADAMPADATPPDVANDVAPEPAIRPIIVGSEAEAVEKKRGWWRR